MSTRNLNSATIAYKNENKIQQTAANNDELLIQQSEKTTIDGFIKGDDAFYFRHSKGTSNQVCLTTGGFVEVVMRSMKAEGRFDLLSAIIKKCQDCGEEMRLKCHDKNWKHYAVGCHGRLKKAGKYLSLLCMLILDIIYVIVIIFGWY